MIRRLGLLLVPLLLLPAPAYAGSWSGPDPTGDAEAIRYDPEPQPCGTVSFERSTVGDIRRLGVAHRRDAVRLVLDVAGLRHLDEVYLTIPLRTDRREFRVDVDFRRGVRADLWTATSWSGPSEPDECGDQSFLGGASGVDCKRISASTERRGDRVVVVVPRACLKRPRWVQAGAEVQGDTPAGVTVVDTWQRPGTGNDDFRTPEYGARVRAPRGAR